MIPALVMVVMETTIVMEVLVLAIVVTTLHVIPMVAVIVRRMLVIAIVVKTIQQNRSLVHVIRVMMIMIAPETLHVFAIITVLRNVLHMVVDIVQ